MNLQDPATVASASAYQNNYGISSGLSVSGSGKLKNRKIGVLLDLMVVGENPHSAN